MRTVGLHTAVFGKWANRTYYHTSYLTQPRALPNWLGLVSCAWKNCNFRQSLQVLISQGHYSSFVAVFNGLYENSEWHLWSNRNSTHFLRRGQKAEYLNWMILHVKLCFHITFNEQYFTKFQKPLKFGFTEMTVQSHCSSQIWSM